MQEYKDGDKLIREFFNSDEIERRAQVKTYHDAKGHKFLRQIKVGRNEPCPCGSGKKFKNCCIHQVPLKATPIVR